MIELEQALERILAAISSLPAESISPGDGARRFLAEDIVAPISLPPFDNSAMDGYALRAADAAEASNEAPARLRLVGSVPAGGQFDGTLEHGTCVRIFTGSLLPPGADAVVMQEDTQATGDSIALLDSIKPWENIRFAGQDVRAGTVIATAGERLSAAKIALLGAMGIERVSVRRQPAVAIIGTGSELVEPGRPLAAGKIYESNRPAIAALTESCGARPRVLPLVPDTLNATVAALRDAFENSDLVITTGGASVGEHDWVKAAFESMNGKLDFWRVAIKPGKPFVFGRRAGGFLFGLPGNPVSAFVTFILLVRPALLKMQGARSIELPSIPGTLAEAIENPSRRRHFMRVVMDAKGFVRSAGLQASHALASLAAANGLLDLAPGIAWPPGHPVQVLKWEG